METGLVTVTSEKAFLDLGHRDKLSAATEMADLLKDLIRKQKFFQVIQGKEYVKVEGWITLGTLLGVIPREKSVRELTDGSFVAEVDLVRADSGNVIGGASALCSIKEKRWANADDYARRSMAITRATGKAYRVSFGWIIGLAGYEVCNAEEMPEIITIKKEEAPKVVTIEKEDDTYQGTPDQKYKLTSYLKTAGYNDEKIQVVLAKMQGKKKDSLQEIMNDLQ